MTNIAISSAAFHNINLRHICFNNASGDCIFESCWDQIYATRKEEFLNIDMKLPNHYNLREITIENLKTSHIALQFYGGTKERYIKELNQLLEVSQWNSEVGDLVLPGIAMTMNKNILVFMTNPNIINNINKPVILMTPKQLGGPTAEINTDIPLILCYTGSHYEGLVPNTENDVKETIALVKRIEKGEYSYNLNDIPVLRKQSQKQDQENRSISKQADFQSKSNHPNNYSPPTPKLSDFFQQSTPIIHRSFTNPTFTRCWLNAPLQTILNCLDYKKQAYENVTSDLGKYMAKCQNLRKYNNSQDAINIMSLTSGYTPLQEGLHDCRQVFKALRDGNYQDISQYFTFTQSIKTIQKRPCTHTREPQTMKEVVFMTETNITKEQSFIKYVQHCLNGVKTVSASFHCTTCYTTRAAAKTANALGSTKIIQYKSGTPDFFVVSNEVLPLRNKPPIKIDPKETLTLRSVITT